MSILVKKSLATSYNSGLRLVKSFRPSRNHASFVDKDAIKNRLQNSGLPDNYREGITAAIDAVLEENKAYTSNNMVSRDELKKLESDLNRAISEAKREFLISLNADLVLLDEKIDNSRREMELFERQLDVESKTMRHDLLKYSLGATVSVLASVIMACGFFS